MIIGIFTDTYYPQISGVCTSILTLEAELRKLGHSVIIFTTTDPLLTPELAKVEEHKGTVVRLRSVPFISMPERRFVMAGLPAAIEIANKYHLDIIHTQTEFGVGVLGKMVANRLKIPVIHTLHTKYEDYLHYIANGRLIRPGAVKYIIRTFLLGTEGVICPSEMTEEAALGYGVKCPIRIIPTGIELSKFTRPDLTAEKISDCRKSLQSENEALLLSVSRLSYEKNIQAVIRALPEILKEQAVKLIIVGHGPYRQELEDLTVDLGVAHAVKFVGAVKNDEVALYYKACDFAISASTSETQGLTYSEALAAGTPILAAENPYLRRLVNRSEFGRLFATDGDIADVTLAALRARGPIPKDLYEAKCQEISAATFGKSVADFYEWMIANYTPFTERVRERVMEYTVEPVKENSSKIVTKVAQNTSQIKTFLKKYGKIRKKSNKNKDT